MQTFMPCSDFREVARILDDRRLHNQVNEAATMLRALLAGPLLPDGRSTPWYNHPMTQAWLGNEAGLARYGEAMLDEVCERAHGDASKHAASRSLFASLTEPLRPLKGCAPEWVDYEPFKASHRALLVRKDPDDYKWLIDDDLNRDAPLLYPVRVGTEWRYVERLQNDSGTTIGFRLAGTAKARTHASCRAAAAARN